MAYHIVDPDDVDPLEGRPSEARSISDAVGLEELGLRVYEARPGEQIPLAYHYHDDQEEAFYVLEGSLHVETPQEEFVVQRGELFVAEPGSPHRAFNPAGADEDARILAIGAPSVDDVHAFEP